MIDAKNQCVEKCTNDYKYEFNNTCYESCPEGTYYDYDQTKCLDNIPDGFYCNDTQAKTLDKCYKTCKRCEEKGETNNHKCTSCDENYTLNGTNCYEICDYFYYFDQLGEYHCSPNDECISDFPKKIKEKKRCVNNCINDDYYKLEYNSVCYNICPEGTKISEDNPNECEGYLICDKFFNYEHTECLDIIPVGYFCNDTEAKTIDKCNNKCNRCSKESYENNLCISCNTNEGFYPKEKDISNKYDFMNCYNSLPEGYYLDTIEKIYKLCYKTCKKCEEIGNIKTQKCLECYPDFTLNDTNCYKKCEYYYYFDTIGEHHCTEKNECPNGYKIIKEKNKCIDNCQNDDKYKYEFNNTCYENPVKSECEEESLYINKITKECLNDCSVIDFFNNICGLRDNNSKRAIDYLIKMIEKAIENGKLNSLIIKVINGSSKDLLIKESKISYQITTSKNQKNIKYENISTLSLGECEDILKKIYNIDKSLSLIIFKIDYIPNNSLIPLIGYQVYHPLNYSKLDLNYCEGQLSSNSIPVEIDEINIYKYDPNSEYYLDQCFSYSTENGTDILLKDRQDEFNNNNFSICANNCLFKDYLTDSKKSICICEINSDQIVISEINDKDNLFSINFMTTTDFSSIFATMKCYDTLFSITGIYRNIALYIFLSIVIILIISAISFYRKGYNSIIKIIESIMLDKGKSTEDEPEIKEKAINIFIERSNQNYSKDFFKISTPKNRKITNLTHKGIIPPEDINSLNNYSSNQRSISKIELKCNNEMTYAKKKTININYIDINKKKMNESKNYNDYELNSFSYKDAIENDHRKYCKYYFSLIRTKHPLIISFCNINDFNSKIIKFDLFWLNFSFNYFINYLFITRSTIHKIYKDGGRYNLGHSLPKIIYSFLISHVLISLIKYLSLSEGNINEIKKESNPKKANEKAKQIKKALVIKYILFFSLGIILVLFEGYCLSSFGAVYQNTQIYLIINTLISIAISLIYPFIINLLPGILRINSLKDTIKKSMYDFSKIIQLL